MKKTKRMLSVLLSLVIALAGLAALYIPANAAYKTGDTMYYGSYPQTEVTASLGDTLNDLSGALSSELSDAWISYGYNNSDCMKYRDITYNNAKYRGVIITTNRPIGGSYSNTQKDNGYLKNNVYWFKFEPVRWRVLDPSAGFLLCDSIIDSQPFSVSLSNPGTYACNYASSSIRTWLNNDFYNTAFSSAEKAAIQTTALTTTSALSPDYDSPATNDKIFLLSMEEATTKAYGFSSSIATRDMSKLMEGNDYAKCQGLWVCRDEQSVYIDFSCWWLRTPWSPVFVCGVEHDGHINDTIAANHTNFGVCPAMKIGNLNAGITLSSIAVKTKPAKTDYNIGESFSQSGLTLTATYSDGSTETITSGFTCTGFSSASAGTKTITVTYEGKTTTFTVTVKASAEAPKLTGIVIKTMPSKTVYTYRRDKNLDTAGLEIEATYSDGSKKMIDPAACKITGYSAKPAGNKTITVEFEGKTAQFNVTVKYVWWQWIIRILLLGFIWY